MLKHIKPRDIIQFMLTGFSFLALILIAGFLETAPIALAIWVAVGLATALWIVWIILVARDRREELRPRLMIMRNGEWVDVDDAAKTHSREHPIFDQDDYKE